MEEGGGSGEIEGKSGSNADQRLCTNRSLKMEIILSLFVLIEDFQLLL